MRNKMALMGILALSVAGNAYAANPFSDLPENHWAYSSINKLVANGVVEGYPDKTYGGEKLITRYEAAQIVAKALVNGKIKENDKLAAEFADELNSLGVRIARLEEKTDNVKIAGQIRTSYANYEKGAAKMFGSGHSGVMRSRIFFTGQVNDNWSYQAVLQNIQDFTNKTGDEKTEFQRAFVTGDFGNTKVTLGRYHNFWADGNLYDHRVDGAKVTFGKELKTELEYGKLSYADGTSLGSNFYRAAVSGKVKDFNFEGNYIKIDSLNKLDGKSDRLWTVGAKQYFGKLYTSAMYLKSDREVAGEDAGYVFGVGYGGTKAEDVGSWGIWSKYYKQPAGVDIMHTMAAVHPTTGFKGWCFGADYTIAKNMILDMEYYTLKDLQDGVQDSKYNTLWTHVMILF